VTRDRQRFAQVLCMTMQDITIRRAEAGDLDSLAASSAALFAEDGAARDRLRDPRWPARHGAAWIAGLAADPDALLLAAVTGDVVGGHLIGYLQPATPMWTGPRAELVSIYVRPDLRGTGVGSQLAADFAAWARARGAVRLQVTAYTANDAAVRFYQRIGYAPLSTELAADLLDNRRLHGVRGGGLAERPLRVYVWPGRDRWGGSGRNARLGGTWVRGGTDFGWVDGGDGAVGPDDDDAGRADRCRADIGRTGTDHADPDRGGGERGDDGGAVLVVAWVRELGLDTGP
jgi:GNAT superfamily N-acetyltransferase